MFSLNKSSSIYSSIMSKPSWVQKQIKSFFFLHSMTSNVNVKIYRQSVHVELTWEFVSRKEKDPCAICQDMVAI